MLFLSTDTPYSRKWEEHISKEAADEEYCLSCGFWLVPQGGIREGSSLGPMIEVVMEMRTGSRDLQRGKRCKADP